MKFLRSICGIQLVAVAAVVMAPAAFGQQGGAATPPATNAPTTPPAGGAPSTGGGNRQPQMPTERQPQQQPTQQMPQIERPIYLSGKVVMQDGSAPPETVTIERICNGLPVPEAYTDSKGRFSFQVGRNQSMLPDASISSSGMGRNPGMGGLDNMSRGGGMTGWSLTGCELRATLAGHRSDVVQLTGRRAMENPDVGTIVLRRLGNVEGLTISATTLTASKDARKAWEKGQEALKKKKLTDAEKELTKAVELHPKFAAAWEALGRVHEQNNKLDEARKAYEQSIASDAKYMNPYIQLAGMAVRESKWQDVNEITAKVIKMNPIDFPQAFFYNAIANLQLQNIDEAEKSAREALKLDEFHRIPRIDHVLGIILANKHDYAGAAEHLNKYIKQAPKGTDLELVKKQLAEIDRMSGGNVVGQAQPKK